jgi:hypothetical protein
MLQYQGVFFQGLDYLHSSPIGNHGNLSSYTCLIDQNWIVKLTGFGLEEFVVRWTKNKLISVSAEDADYNLAAGAGMNLSDRRVWFF